MKRALRRIFPLFFQSLSFVLIAGAVPAFASLAQLPTAPVAEYLFNGDGNDSGPFELHGQFMGNATLATDRFDNPESAASFDGENDLLLIPEAPVLNISGDLSIVLWIKTNVGTMSRTVFGNMYDHIPCDGYILGTREGNALFMSGCEAESRLWSVTRIDDGVWHQIAVTVSGSTATLYVDGRADVSRDVTPIFYRSLEEHPLAGVVDQSIGASYSGAFAFAGLVDDVSVFDYALSPDQVDLLYNRQPYDPPLYQPQPPETSGPVAGYPLNGNALEGTGNGHYGEVVGAVPTPDRFEDPAGAMLFDGRDDYVKIPHDPNLDIAGDLSITVWVKARDLVYGQHIFSNMLEISPHDGFMLSTWQGTLRFMAGDRSVFSSVRIDDGAWKHVAVTLSGTTATIYINGQPDVYGQVGIPYYSQPLDQYIGDAYSHAYQFKGAIDDLNIYNRALSAEEVAAMYTPVPNQSPILDPIGNKSGMEGERLTFTLAASDSNSGDILTFGSSNLPPGATLDPVTGNFDWIPSYDQAGNFENIDLYVMDNGVPVGIDAELITITIGSVNRPPLLSPLGSQICMENESLSFTVLASDPDGDIFTLSSADLPLGAQFSSDSGLFNWVPDSTQAGNYTVTFRATDSGSPAQTGALDVIITVGDVPTPQELSAGLVSAVIGLELPLNIENAYTANLKKVDKFIELGKTAPALNQLEAFVGKVEENFADGVLSPEVRNDLYGRAKALIALIAGN